MTHDGAYLTTNEHVNYVGMDFGEKTYGLESSEPVCCIEELGTVLVEDCSSNRLARLQHHDALETILSGMTVCVVLLSEEVVLGTGSKPRFCLKGKGVAWELWYVTPPMRNYRPLR